jgi:hypothetical protein
MELRRDLRLDYITILMADGSKKTFLNTAPSTDTGKYVSSAFDDLSYAIVGKNAQSFRHMHIKDPDGLTYFFTEHSVDYYGYSNTGTLLDPRIMYLEKIISLNQDTLVFDYEQSWNGHGRNVFLRTYPTNGSTFLGGNNPYSDLFNLKYLPEILSAPYPLCQIISTIMIQKKKQ